MSARPSSSRKLPPPTPDYGTRSTNNRPGGSVQRPDNTTALEAEADLTIEAEAVLGIELQDFEPAEQSFLIALSTAGTDVEAVSHLTHP